MPRAIWNGKIVAQSDRFETVEGNIYFPPETIKRDFFRASETHTFCPWKGTASYYTLVVEGRENVDAAWFYPRCKEAAKNIEGYVAFWRGVKVES